MYGCFCFFIQRFRACRAVLWVLEYLEHLNLPMAYNYDTGESDRYGPQNFAEKK